MTDEAEPAKKKRKKTKSPTARALEECRRRGYICQVVEQTIPRMFIKRDLFGVIDVLAITPSGILGIQATSGSNHASRVHKIHAEPRARAWLEHARLEVWTFTKRADSQRWEIRVERIAAEDCVQATATEEAA